MCHPVAVTGGAGLIGSHLVESLLADGHHVIAIDDLSGGSAHDLPLDHRHLDLVVAEVGSTGAHAVVDTAIGDAALVFHLASPIGVGRAHRDPDRTATSILTSTTHVVEACRRHRRPLLYTSSSEVYGPVTGGHPLAEDDLAPFGPEPRWSYGRAKLAAERLVAGLADDAVDSWVVRLFNVVGPRQRPDTGLVVANMCAAAAAGEPIVIHDDGRAVRSFLHVVDAVAALRRVAGHAALRARPVNVGGDERLSIAELAQIVAASVDPHVLVGSVPSAAAFGPGFAAVDHRVPDLRRLRSAVDFRPRRSVTDAIDDWLHTSRPVGTMPA